MTRIVWNRSLTISLVFIGLALLVIGMYAPDLMKALFADTIGDDPRTTKIASSVDRHDDFMATDVARLNGRYLFYAPPAWPPPPVVKADPPPAPPKDDTPAPPPPPPSAPATYTGPTPNAILGDLVWFVGGDVRTVGDEPTDGVQVLGIKPPWTVVIAHKGGEYDVPLFDDDGKEPFFLDEPMPAQPVPGLVEAKDDADEASP